MPYKEAASWVCLTMFGAAIYFIFDWWGQERIAVAIVVAAVSLVGLGYLVYQHHHPKAKLPSSGIWVWLPLVLTWGLLAYAITVSRNAIASATPAEIPEFDAPNKDLGPLDWGKAGPSCYATVNGEALLSRQKQYKLALACFIYDGKEDILDAPYVQFSNTYEIRPGDERMSLTVKPYFVNYANQLHAVGVDVSILMVPNGLDPTGFTTLRQARAAGIKILTHSVASGGP